jgi:hypothetical protein
VSPCCIVAAVGDGMSNTTGVAGRFFSALGTAGINILAIAQGCSERVSVTHHRLSFVYFKHFSHCNIKLFNARELRNHGYAAVVLAVSGSSTCFCCVSVPPHSVSMPRRLYTPHMQLAQLTGTTDSDAGCDLALTTSYCVLCNASLTPVHTSHYCNRTSPV